MISVQEATEIIAQRIRQFPFVELPLNESRGCILYEDVHADRDFPPFDRVSMDGIAFRFDAWKSLETRFWVEDIQHAGEAQKRLKEAENGCIEIMTGAVCPEGADCVIRYEDVDFGEENGKRFARLTVSPEKVFQNIHKQGLDRKAGEVLMKAGRKIGPPEIAVAATVGKAKLKVCRPPKTAIISTGDELVEVEQTPLPHQIRMSNVHALQQAMAEMGIKANRYHLRDNLQQMRDTLEMLVESCDLLILSGGVSKGKADYVPQILEELGVEKHFHRVMQRPGKPIWFGSKERGPVVFALPGNPVSTFMCFHRYAKRWIEESMGLPPAKAVYAMLTESVSFRPDLSYFMQAKTFTAADGRLMAHPIQGHGSGDFANLLDCDAFVELPQGRDVYPQGAVFEVIKFRNI